jgi:hypothetical protein
VVDALSDRVEHGGEGQAYIGSFTHIYEPNSTTVDLGLSDLIHPHIVRRKLGRDRGSCSCRASKSFRPFPRPRTQPRHIREIG